MNSTIKIHLDPEEFAPIDRLARDLHVTPETVAYAGLDLLMQQAGDPGVRRQIGALQARASAGLPRWADSARGVHIYESKQDE